MEQNMDNLLQYKKVLIAGGTGFLGYHSVLKFLELEFEVGIIALENEINLDGMFPNKVEVIYADLFKLSQAEITTLVKNKGYDSFVYALGPDDRVTPNAPAFDFFKEKLVDECKKICLAVKEAGIKRCTVLNSYFAYFDKKLNGKLSKSHPYIRARRLQQQELFNIGQTGVFDVMMLELPYIFGTMPNREPLWKKSFLDKFAKFKKIYFPNGGTASIDVGGVAEAVVATTLNGKNGRAYPVGKENILFKDMINIMMEGLGSKKRFSPIPAWVAYLGGLTIRLKDKKEGKEGGLNYAKLMTQIQSKKFYYDTTQMRKELNYESLGFGKDKDVKTSILETMESINKTK